MKEKNMQNHYEVMKTLLELQRQYKLQQKNPFVSKPMRMQYSQMEYAIRTAIFLTKEQAGDSNLTVNNGER